MQHFDTEVTVMEAGAAHLREVDAPIDPTSGGEAAPRRPCALSTSEGERHAR